MHEIYKVFFIIILSANFEDTFRLGLDRSYRLRKSPRGELCIESQIDFCTLSYAFLSVMIVALSRFSDKVLKPSENSRSSILCGEMGS